MVDIVCHARKMAAGCIPPFSTGKTARSLRVHTGSIFHSSAQWKCFRQSSWGTHRFPRYLCFAWIHFPWSDEECCPWHPRVGAVAGHVWKSHFYHLASREHLPFLPLVQKEKRVMSLKETLWNQSLAGFSTGKWEHQWENESINDLIHTGDTTWHYLFLPLHGQAEMLWKGRRAWQWRSCQCMVKISS